MPELFKSWDCARCGNVLNSPGAKYCTRCGASKDWTSLEDDDRLVMQRERHRELRLAMRIASRAFAWGLFGAGIVAECIAAVGWCLFESDRVGGAAGLSGASLLVAAFVVAVASGGKE